MKNKQVEHIPDLGKKRCVDCWEEILGGEEFQEGSFGGVAYYSCEKCAKINAQGIEDANNSVKVGE